MSCLCECCSRCLEYCLSKTQKHKKNKEYAGIRYRSPQEANLAVSVPEIPSLPMTKAFEFPQQQSQYPVHPQIPQIPQIPQRVITVQPRAERYHTFQPIPSTSTPRGRSHTFSGHASTLYQSRPRAGTDESPMVRPRAESVRPQMSQMLHPAPFSWRRTSSLPPPESPTTRQSPKGEDSRSSSWRHLDRAARGHSVQASESGDSPETTESSILRSRANSPSQIEPYDGSTELRFSSELSDDPDGASSLPVVPSVVPSLTKQERQLSVIHFSLYFDVQCHTLTVSLERAENLLPGPAIGSFDPFVVLYLDPNKVEIHESQVKRNTLNPNFSEAFVFQKLMPDEVRRQTLVCHVYNHKKVRYLIGTALVPLGEVDMFGIPLSAELDIDSKEVTKTSKGNLLLSLKYLPQHDQIKGVVLKATNLLKQDIVGSADPYVKIYLMCEGRRLAKWKTSVRKNTLIPIFNERFQFHVPYMDLSSVALEIRVMDYDRFTPNDLMGVVLIGENVAQESGREHWAEMISSVNQAVSNWHPILSGTTLRKYSSV